MGSGGCWWMNFRMLGRAWRRRSWVLLVGVHAHADGVGDIEGMAGELRVELADEEGSIRRLGEEEEDGIEVRARHGKEPGGFCDQFAGEGLAAEIAEIDALAAEELDGVGAGGLAVAGIDPGAGQRSGDAGLVREQFAKKALGHGAAADVACADEQGSLGCGGIGHDTREWQLA